MRTTLLLVLMLFSQNLLAEGGSCPDGFYPIGGQGTSGCAPSPESAEGTISSAVPRVNWVTTWGAIAFSKTANAVGVFVGGTTENEAKQAALEDCKKAGGSSGCWVDMTYHNQCAAIAWGDTFGTASGAETKEIASGMAIDKCVKES